MHIQAAPPTPLSAEGVEEERLHPTSLHVRWRGRMDEESALVPTPGL